MTRKEGLPLLLAALCLVPALSGAKQGEAFLQVVSEPRGADVFINEKKVGVTPTERLSLTPGQYKLRISLSEHKQVEAKIFLRIGAERLFRAVLVAMPSAEPPRRPSSLIERPPAKASPPSRVSAVEPEITPTVRRAAVGEERRRRSKQIQAWSAVAGAAVTLVASWSLLANSFREEEAYRDSVATAEMSRHIGAAGAYRGWGLTFLAAFAGSTAWAVYSFVTMPSASADRAEASGLQIQPWSASGAPGVSVSFSGRF